ncbi:MAG TPA: thioredoxin domain-containing protein [Spirochaetota bacterium]|nr:thioredoxin domain-containing protein [Spirochaetota bacterium]
MSTSIEVADGNFTTEALGANGTVLVDFWAPHCGLCRMQTPDTRRNRQRAKRRLPDCKA